MKLVTEYLVIIDKKSNEAFYLYCNNKDAFDRLLQKDSDIIIAGETLKYKNTLELSYQIKTGNISGKDQRFFQVKIEFEDDEQNIIELINLLKSFKTLIGEVNKQFDTKTPKLPETLRDDVSQYFASKAYPLLHSVENQMRQLITYFMLTNVGMDWVEEASPDSFQETVKKSKRKQFVDTLYQIDFIDLKSFLFTKYSTVTNQEVIAILEKANTAGEVEFGKLKEFVPQSNWERYFFQIVNCKGDYLEKKWQELYELRCIVAHNAILNKGEYEKIVQFTDEVSKILQKAIDNLDQIKITEEDKEQILENVARQGIASINKNLNPIFRNTNLQNFNSLTNDSLNQLFQNSNLSSFNSAINKNFTGIRQSINLQNLISAIPDNIREIAGLRKFGVLENTALQTNLESIKSGLFGSAIYGTYTGLQSAAYNPAIDAYQRFIGNALSNRFSGQPISRFINLSVNPKFSSDLKFDEGSKDLKIEALVDETASEIEDAEEFEEQNESYNEQHFEFDDFPIAVKITYRQNQETWHKVRRPNNNEWFEWANNLERERHYLTPEEIEKDNEGKDPEDQDPLNAEIYSDSYSEFEASINLYGKIILEIAGIKISKEDNFSTEDFRQLPQEFIKKIPFGIKRAIVTKLYKCFCWSGKNSGLEKDQKIVYQQIPCSPESFKVEHILRIPSEEEGYNFRTKIIGGNFAKNEEEQEIIKLQLNLQLAVEFYDRHIIDIKNATVRGVLFNEETRIGFIEKINPIYKFRVLQSLLNISAWYFDIDDYVLP